ncbi:MAG TPA: ABC transporter ATP-binding protein, partial [Terrimesophilobacter sp.]|nr:ABC transporter ATP-binding protein [Terrimesophilobacter sp.]
DLLRRQTGALSGGQKRRLSVALAFVGRPKLVLLDEPTTGLDVDGRRTLWEAVRRQHQAGATVVLTSHYLEEIEALAERVIVIDRGRVLVDDDLTTVVGRVGLRMLRLSTPAPDAVAALREVVKTRAEEDGSHTFFVRDADRAVVALVNSGIPFTGLTVRGATLEEAFLTITARPTSTLASSAVASSTPEDVR